MLKRCAISLLFMTVLSVVSLVPPRVCAEEHSRRTPVVEAVEKVGPSVVNISTERITERKFRPFGGADDDLFDKFFEDFYGRQAPVQRVKTISLGSGVVYTSDGYILTNEHVVRKASKIHVTLTDGQQYEASLISTDPASDLALIKIEPKKPLKAVEMETPDSLLIGETVIALGNPFGLESSVTSGVLSARNRKILAQNGQVAFDGLFQTDASINPGNSGGPLVNINGKLLGINTAIYAEAQGIGFAIPVDKILASLETLLDYRSLHKVWLGFETAKKDRVEGAVIEKVAPDTNGQKQGLLPGDIIFAANDKPVRSNVEFKLLMMSVKASDKLKLRIVRNKEEKEITVEAAPTPKPDGAKLARQKLGFTLQALTPDLATALGVQVKNGVIVTEIEAKSPVASAGFAIQDILIKLNGVDVASLDEVGQILENIRPGESVRVFIFRQKVFYFADITTR